MTWISKIIHVEIETGEILTEEQIYSRNLEMKSKETKYKTHATHIERIIIKLYGARQQQKLW